MRHTMLINLLHEPLEDGNPDASISVGDGVLRR